MKLSLPFFFILTLAMLGIGCQSSKERDAISTTHKKITKTGKITTEADDFSFHYIDTSLFYIGNIDNIPIGIKIYKAEKQLIEGIYYNLSQETTSSKHFSIYREKGKCKLTTPTISTHFIFDAIHDQQSIEALIQIEQPKDSIIWLQLTPLIKPNIQECHSERYTKELFSIEEITNIEYGKAKGYWTSMEPKDEKYLRMIAKNISKTSSPKNLALTLDLYLPKDDTIKQRPLIVLLHGGAFYIGDKSDIATRTLCEYFAKLGYVTASINYRMGFKINKSSIQECGFKAIQDAHAAMRFLVHNAETYGIDTNALFIGGASAGAITALNLVYMSENSRPSSTLFLGDKASSGNSLSEKFHIRGIINMWGAVYNLHDLDLIRVPILSFHGTKDPIIPFNEGIPFSDINKLLGQSLFDKMYGSQAIHQRLDSLQVKNSFYPLTNAKHGPHKNNNKLTSCFYFIQEKTSQFIYDEIAYLPEITPSKETPKNYLLASREIAQTYWDVEGGFILSYDKNHIEVVWDCDKATHKITATGFKQNGIAFCKEFYYTMPQIATTN